jgi:hypothetical protein
MLLLALTSAFVLAADTITVGHPSLKAVAPRFGVDTTEIYVERDGKRQLINTGVQAVSKTADGILVAFFSRGRNGPSIDSVTISPSTMAPIRHVESFGDKQATFAFRDGRITGTSKDSTGEHAVDVQVGANRFDFSVVQQVTRALPLVAGYEATILTYDVALMKERSVGYKVVSEDKLTWHGSEVAAWKTITAFDTHQVTRYIDAKTRRDLQWEITAPNMHMIGITK